ncbi:hypothetical protein HPB48_012404 [Haemaphysalis longicornis]|uniref:Uncharacterized protein n=1 Tax=Haemaphysalis longicornis TaxID=44386 RepID=A0A9J6G461_HAELO|nr:hypothetical protein HPB48_012404 [Haemaphysalis longicornis]
MNLTLYPFDTQKCHIIIRPYAYTVNEIDLVWKQGIPVTLEYPLKLSDFQLVDYYNRIYNKELPTGGDPSGARGLGAVTLLTLVSLASSARASIPRVAYIKAIDVWYATCIMFVFALLSVATCTHYLVRVRLRPLFVRRVDHCLVDAYQRLVYGRRTDPFLLSMDQDNKLEQHRNVKMSQAFERVARVMFPVCFGFFNVVYWSFYVERSYYPTRPS